jgi:hypothetical protein
MRQVLLVCPTRTQAPKAGGRALADDRSAWHGSVTAMCHHQTACWQGQSVKGCRWRFLVLVPPSCIGDHAWQEVQCQVVRPTCVLLGPAFTSVLACDCKPAPVYGSVACDGAVVSALPCGTHDTCVLAAIDGPVPATPGPCCPCVMHLPAAPAALAKPSPPI